jgi:hypothetical protein
MSAQLNLLKDDLKKSVLYWLTKGELVRGSVHERKIKRMNLDEER